MHIQHGAELQVFFVCVCVCVPRRKIVNLLDFVNV